MAIFEARVFTLKPGTTAKYLELLAGVGMEAQSATAPNLAGCFTAETGTLNRVIQLWRWDDWAQREQRRAEVLKHPRLPEYSQPASAMLESMSNELWLPASFSRMK